MFLSLPAPSSDEFIGEFDGYSPDYLGPMDAEYVKAGLGGWLGKGYRRETYKTWLGHGYNIWEIDGVAHRQTRFGWGMGVSSLDGQACLLMHYRAFDTFLA